MNGVQQSLKPLSYLEDLPEDVWCELSTFVEGDMLRQVQPVSQRGNTMGSDDRVWRLKCWYYYLPNVAPEIEIPSFRDVYKTYVHDYFKGMRRTSIEEKRLRLREQLSALLPDRLMSPDCIETLICGSGICVSFALLAFFVPWMSVQIDSLDLGVFKNTRQVQSLCVMSMAMGGICMLLTILCVTLFFVASGLNAGVLVMRRCLMHVGWLASSYYYDMREPTEPT